MNQFCCIILVDHLLLQENQLLQNSENTQSINLNQNTFRLRLAIIYKKRLLQK